ncbi:hypothetical protein [Vibrio sp. R78045]|uniref:hypothetical protein n=1 Tax=Vibrio sp. R78045 TaxID=3093868 RepID=UPI0036F3137F
MSQSKPRNLDKEQFVAGTFESFVRQQALLMLEQPKTSVRKLPTNSQKELGGYALTEQIASLPVFLKESLESKKNPLTDQEILKKYDFDRKLDYIDIENRDNEFDLDRAVEIALADPSPELGYLRNLADDGSRYDLNIAMREHLSKSVKQEISSTISGMALNTCFNNPEFNLNDLVLQHEKSVVEPLNEMVKFQNDLPVKLASFHDVKKDILQDYSNMEFLTQHGAALAKSDCTPKSLGALCESIRESNMEIPKSLSNLHFASMSELLDSPVGMHYMQSALPSNEMDLAAVFARERIAFTSDDFKSEMFMEKSEIVDFSIKDHMDSVMEKAQDKPQQSLADLLKSSSMDSPSDSPSI